MSSIIGVLIFLPLLTAGIAHLLWSLGIRWPISDKALLARTVVGTPGEPAMPNKLLTFIVALFILGAATAGLAVADHSSGGWWLTLIGAALALVFLTRGVLGFTAQWRTRFPTEPFATYDRKLYSPVILAIGIGFLILVIMRLT